MRKLSCLILFLTLAFITQAKLVDDFDSYPLGGINTSTTTWVGNSDGGINPSTATIAVDPVDSTNKVIQLTEGGGTGQQWVRRTLSSAETIGAAATSTLFMRVKATAEIDSSIGLTDLDAPTTNWGDFRVQFIMHNAMQIRDGGSVRNLAFAATGTAVPWNTNWYNVWLVVDNAADNVKVYINQTDVDATEADRCVRSDLLTQNTFAFRTTTTEALDCFFWRAQNNANTRLMQVDDIHMTSGIDLKVPPRLKPYGPEVVQGTPIGLNIPTTLKWNAGADPAGVLAVNPDIVAQYVFMRSDLEPNLVYKGALGDPGNTPASQYSITGTLDRTYYWAVVEALSGYAHDGVDNPLLTVNNSELKDVDPNNIIGSTWSYQATKSMPVINVHPADTRVFPTGHPNADLNASFTVEFFSAVNPVTVTWYKNGAALTGSETDVTITTDPFTYSTLTIATPVLADEGKYYAQLSVQEGTADDLYTNTRLLVIKQELARFDFENNLDDTSGNGAPSGIMKTVSLTDPNEFIATVVASPAYDSAGIDGSAIMLDGTQFVDFGTEGYPKAGPLDTIGDIRGTAWYKKGFGRGMDEGSILCWVKLASDGVIYLNANNNSVAPGTDDTHFGLTTNGIANARIIIRGENTDIDGTAQILGEANGAYQMAEFDLKDGGLWHMFAATWSNSTARVYINGEEVANNTQGYTEVYRPWERGNLLGTSRTLTRHILNANDFVTGSIDKLRVYNYVISKEEIETEYETLSGNSVCNTQVFTGNVANLDNTAGSYCVVNLADAFVIIENWLHGGL